MTSISSQLISESTENGELVNPVECTMTYTISVKAGAVPAGEIIRCWMPYPKESNSRQTNVDLLINNMDSHCSIILYGLIRGKQLYFQFHKNTKLLIFWMDLFNHENELEFTHCSWIDFVTNVQQNKSFKKFTKFKKHDMINVLQQNYEILTIKEFLKYVLEYECGNMQKCLWFVSLSLFL